MRNDLTIAAISFSSLVVGVVGVDIKESSTTSSGGVELAVNIKDCGRGSRSTNRQ